MTENPASLPLTIEIGLFSALLEAIFPETQRIPINQDLLNWLLARLKDTGDEDAYVYFSAELSWITGDSENGHSI